MRKDQWVCIPILMVVVIAVSAVFYRPMHRVQDDRLSVITTLFPQYDMARAIGGEQADVRFILLPGQESHMYDPTPDDMTAISDSDLFIYTGDEMEPWAGRLSDSVDMSHVTVVDASVGIEMHREHEDEEEDEEHETQHALHHHEHGLDPHIWLDLQNAAVMAENITRAFAERDPENAALYTERGEAYIRELLLLDQELKDTVAAGSRKDIVFGGQFAYGYFVDAYGLAFESVYESCQAETEPSMSQMARVIEYMKENQVGVILYEPLSTATVAGAIAETTGAEMAAFSTCHNVTRDEMAEGITFFDLIRRNRKAIEAALR